eukprot:UN13206
MTRASRLPLYLALGFVTYSGYSFYDKFIHSTTKLQHTPSTCLLDQKCHETLFSKPSWSDCYQIEVKGIKVTNKDYDSMDVTVNALISELIAKSLYTSSVFKMEKYLFRKLGYWNLTEEDLLNSRFNIGEIFGVFKVISKTNDQILFEWHDEYSNWTGITYLSANVVSSSNDSNCNCIDILVTFGTGSVKPLQLPLVAKLFAPFHGIYSSMLLVSPT